MKNQTQYSETAANSRRASSRLKLVLLGALAPTALFALPVGTMMFVGPGGETASVAGTGPALDCASPRNAWRPACQTAKSNLMRDADVTGSINDGPAPTGAVDQKAKRRSVAGTPATAQPYPSAVNLALTPSTQAAAPTVSPMRKDVAQASPEPGRTEPNPPSGREAGTWQDPVRPADLAQTTKAPASPPSPASQPTSVQGEPAKAAQDRILKPESVQAAAAPSADQARASETKPDSAASLKAPVSAPATPTAEAAPTHKVKTAAAGEVSKPVDDEEPVHRPLRRELRRTARPAPALAARATPRARVVAARSVEEPARPVRHRVRPGRVEEAENISRPETVASFSRAPRRIASTRRPAAPGNLQVSSVQTYYMADGRRVVVNVPPRPDLVRELAAYHAANFSGRRRAAAASSWGGAWFGDSDD